MAGASPAALSVAGIWDVMPNAACLCDADGVILRYSRGAVEIWGREPRLADPGERYCGSHRLFWPDGSSLAHHDTPMAEALRTGRSCRNTAVVIEQPSGHRVHTHLNVDPIRDEAGRIVGAINCLSEITALREAESRLRDAEQKLRDVLNALPSAVYTTDAEGRVTFFNQAAADLAGHKPKLGTDRWCVSWKLHGPQGAALAAEDYPVAIALRQQRPARGLEAVAERPDGSRVAVVAYPTPLFDRDGHLAGAVNTLVELGDRRLAEESAGRLAAIVEFSDDAIVSKNTSGIIQTWNAGAERLFGYTADEVIGLPITILIPLDRQDEEPGILRRIGRGERIDHYETVRIRKDGTPVDISLTISPLKGADGRIIGASKIARDISERRHAERRRQILVNELNHRVKNMLATVQSIATQTFRGETDGGRLTQFDGRLVALSRTHDVLTRESWEGADLEEIVAGAIAPLCARPEDRFRLFGPPLRLRPKMALALSIAIHELCTNAAHFGALSNGPGRVRIDWTLTGSEPDRQLQLRWEETAGPPVAIPVRRGFGTRMLERALARELGAQARLSFLPGGVVYEIEAPFS